MEKNSEQTIIREARKRDVVSCFFSLLKEYPNEKIGNIFKRVEMHPAPRFYITVENARRFTAMIAKDRKLPLVLGQGGSCNITLLLQRIDVSCHSAFVNAKLPGQVLL